MKPVIGIIPLYDDDKESYWMLPGYMLALEQCGAIPLMMPLTLDQEILDYFTGICDGILLPGGHDVDPDIYGEDPIEECGTLCKRKDVMEGIVLETAIEKDIPLLGICRGFQFINAYLGGSLYQDLPSQYASDLEHHMEPPYDVAIHNVIIDKDSPLYKVVGKDDYPVNSYHHQGVKELAPELSVMAQATDGLVEAFRIPDKTFIWGVQWHPEFSYQSDEGSHKLFESFVSKCRRN